MKQAQRFHVQSGQQGVGGGGDVCVCVSVACVLCVCVYKAVSSLKHGRFFSKTLPFLLQNIAFSSLKHCLSLRSRSAVAFARNAANDCVYALGLGHIPARIRAKLESRGLDAHQQLARHLAAPQPQPQRTAASTPPVTTHVCSGCDATKDRDEYTRNQWKKRRAGATCKSCQQQPAAASAPEPVSPDMLGGCPAADSDASDEDEEFHDAQEHDNPDPAEPEPEPESEPLELPAVVLGRQVGAIARHAGSECPMCLDEWEADELAGECVVALRCGHACCGACLRDFHRQCAVPFNQETALQSLRTVWCCPICRAPLDADTRVYGFAS